MTDLPGTDGPDTGEPGTGEPGTGGSGMSGSGMSGSAAGGPGTPGPGTGGPAAGTGSPPCPRLPESGAYLLGVLSPADRADYATHLAGCADCLREVGQLAGLPGLLPHTPNGDVPGAFDIDPAEQLYGPEPEGPDPVELAVRAVRRKRSHQRMLSAGAAVLVVGAIGGAVVLGRSSVPTVTAGPTAGVTPVAMQQVSGAPLTATVAVAEKSWGSAITMTCRYSGVTPGEAMPVYVLVAVGPDGHSEEIARWRVLPNVDVNIAASTDLAGTSLRALEIRNPAGAVVVRTDTV